MTIKQTIVSLSLLCLIPVLNACGGGSSSSSGMIIEGSFRQGAEVSHSRLAHSAGQALDEVEICALNTCSRTDGNGLWGFATEGFNGGPLLFSLRGHGIEDSVVVEVPSARAVFIEFENSPSNKVYVHGLQGDGVEVSLISNDHNHDDHDHDQHDHDNNHSN